MVGRTRPRLLLDGPHTIVSDSFRWRDLLRDPWVEQDAVAAHLERGSVNHGKAHPLQYTKAQYGFSDLRELAFSGSKIDRETCLMSHDQNLQRLWRASIGE